MDDPATPNTGVGPRAFDDRGAYEYQPPPPVGPTAHLSVAPASGTVPLGVTADASTSTAGSSAIGFYTFDFGDGTTVGPQSGATATHTYTTPGSYTVTVTCRPHANRADLDGDPAGQRDPVVGPTAHLSVAPASGTVPLGVTADASTSTAGSSAIGSYTFDFGDGTTVGPQPGATATHTYTTPGSYTVTVTVTDANSPRADLDGHPAGQREPGGGSDRAPERGAGVGDGAAGGDRGRVDVDGGQLRRSPPTRSPSGTAPRWARN